MWKTKAQVHICFWLLTGVVCSLSAAGQSASKGDITYANDIQPIFKRSCAQCHGFWFPRGKLRLTSLKGVLKGGRNGVAVDIKEPEKSLLVRMIRAPENVVLKMPPGGPRLSQEDKERILTWIRQGAK